MVVQASHKNPARKIPETLQVMLYARNIMSDLSANRVKADDHLAFRISAKRFLAAARRDIENPTTVAELGIDQSKAMKVLVHLERRAQKLHI